MKLLFFLLTAYIASVCVSGGRLKNIQWPIASKEERDECKAECKKDLCGSKPLWKRAGCVAGSCTWRCLDGEYMRKREICREECYEDLCADKPTKAGKKLCKLGCGPKCWDKDYKNGIKYAKSSDVEAPLFVLDLSDSSQLITVLLMATLLVCATVGCVLFAVKQRENAKLRRALLHQKIGSIDSEDEDVTVPMADRY